MTGVGVGGRANGRAQNLMSRGSDNPHVSLACLASGSFLCTSSPVGLYYYFVTHPQL